MATRVTTAGETRVTTAGAERETTDSGGLQFSPLPLPRAARPTGDVRLVVGEAGADLLLEGGDLALDRGLSTAVLVSLFSDGRAPAELDLPPGETSRRGWWGESEGDRFGSLLWLLDREKVTASTLERLSTYARQALAWMVEDGIAERVEAAAVRTGTYEVSLRVALHRGRARRWSSLWEATAADDLLLPGLQVQILPF